MSIYFSICHIAAIVFNIAEIRVEETSLKQHGSY